MTANEIWTSWDLLIKKLEANTNYFTFQNTLELKLRFNKENADFQFWSESEMNKFRSEHHDLWLKNFPLIDCFEKFISVDENGIPNGNWQILDNPSLNASPEINKLLYIYGRLNETVNSIPYTRPTPEQVYGEKEAKHGTKVIEFATSKQQLLILKCLEIQGLFKFNDINESMAKQAKLLYRLFNRSSDNTYSNLKVLPRIEEFNEKDITAVRDYFQEAEMSKVVDLLNSEIEKRKTKKK